LCGEIIGHTEMVRFLDGNLVVIAAQMQKGVSLGEIASGLVVGLVLNGIDFANLAYEPSFSEGRYELTNGDAALGFELFFAKDFAAHATGETIVQNVFSVSSYVTNVRLVGIDPSTGEPNVDYQPGPLFDLIDGAIGFDTSDPFNVSVKIRIRTDVIGFDAF